MNEPIHLLYAEDSPQDADLTRMHFEREAADLRLEVVESGVRCLERLAAESFDLLLLDNHLPDMDGLDVLAKLRAEGHTLPVVMVTGAGDDETVARALRAGAADYVPKSGDYLATLPGILRGLVERQRDRRLVDEVGAHRVRRILYVEPNPMDVEQTASHLAAAAPHLKLHPVPSCLEALALLAPGHEFDLVLTDLRVPGMKALEFIREAQHRGIEIPFIVITGRGDEATAVAILHLGAYDYIVKREGYLMKLPHAIDHALHRFHLDQTIRRLHAELESLNASLEKKVVERTAELRDRSVLLAESQRIAHIGSWGWDLTGPIQWTDETYRIYGVSRETFTPTNESLVDLLHPEDRPAMQGWIAACLAGEQPDDLDFRAILPDGTIRLLNGRGERICDAEGRPTQIVGTVQDITERKRAEEALQLTSERLQTLSRRLLEIQETERRQIARELHDEIGQALTATKINLQSLQRYPEPATIAGRLEESIGIVEGALGQVRSLSLELRPPLLDDLGLAPALRWLTDQHAHRTGLRVEFRSGAVDARFDGAVATACFRVAQEALNNVVRHAGARHVTVELQTQEDGAHLRVSDDGAGFDVPTARRRAAQGASLGLLGMEERATLAGGGIEWRSRPGQGTEVHAWFPLTPPSMTSDETLATS
jgi:two-component system sensor histidine kinase UhpB